MKKILFMISSALFFISSTVIFLILLVDSGKQILSYIIGACFWVFLLTAIGIQIYLSKKRKQKGIFARGIPALKFFQKEDAWIADGIFLVSLAGSILLALFFKNEWLQISFLVSLIFSFEMHCLLNSSNYIFITNNRGKHSHEKD